jgi:hypothetical protein
VGARNAQWYEPEWWRFGEQKSEYHRHAAGQMYALSRALAQYISINSASLHDYQNEDVSVGAWMLGLEAELVDDRKLCCGASTGLFHTPEHTFLCSSWSHLLVIYLCSCGAFVFRFHLASFAFYELMFSFVQMLLVSCSNC